MQFFYYIQPSIAFPMSLCYNACSESNREVHAMAIENGEWIMRGRDWDGPYRIRSRQELIRWIDKVRFLPLFKNEIDGFSAEDHTSDLYWWSGDPEQGPRLRLLGGACAVQRFNLSAGAQELLGSHRGHAPRCAGMGQMKGALSCGF